MQLVEMLLTAVVPIYQGFRWASLHTLVAKPSIACDVGPYTMRRWTIYYVMMDHILCNDGPYTMQGWTIYYAVWYKATNSGMLYSCAEIACLQIAGR